jgi:hypothetical protein
MDINKPGTPLFDFSADVMDIAETKFRANLEDDSEGWVKALYREYQAAGTPKDQRKWITDRIKGEFKSMEKLPKWIDMDNSRWPFHKNKPMVFISQIALKEKPETEGLIDGESVAYFFGLTDTGEHGEVIMVYQEVTITKF